MTKIKNIILNHINNILLFFFFFFLIINNKMYMGYIGHFLYFFYIFFYWRMIIKPYTVNKLKAIELKNRTKAFHVGL